MDAARKIRLIIEPAYVVCADAALSEVSRRMCQEGADTAVVIARASDRPTPIGAITYQDLERVRRERDGNLSGLCVLDILSRHTVFFYEEDTFERAVLRLRGSEGRHVPVIGSGGMLEGVVALEELFRHVANDFAIPGCADSFGDVELRQPRASTPPSRELKR